MEKKHKSVKKTVEIKKSLRDFVADEDGYVSKETILKVGLATVAGVGMLGAMSGSFAENAHTNHQSHSNTTTWPFNGGPCPGTYPDHSNIPLLTNHTSY